MEDEPVLGRRRRMGRQPGGGRAYQRAYYFQAPEAQRKYWGIKQQIRFRKAFPLSEYSYVPMQRGSPHSLNIFGATKKSANPDQRANRATFFMSGRGRYLGGKGLYRGRGGFFGRALGSLIGQGDLGDKLGDAVWNAGKSFVPEPYRNVADSVFSVTDKLSGKGRYMRGRGAYGVNNLVTDGGATATSVVPQFNPTDLHEITYSNREYVRDIYAPSASKPFHVESWFLNPGLVEAFPWLSQLAINFEEYELIQLCYTYKSTVADFASASGQVGQIVMTTQYNPNSDPFADKEEMMLYEGGMSCKTTESLIHGVECDPAKITGAPAKFVRAGSLPPTEDLKNYDLGKTSIAVLNAPSTYAGQQLGELWVSYTVKLRKPKFAAGNAYNVRRDFFQIPQATMDANSLLPGTTQVISDARNSLNSVMTLITQSTLTGNFIPTGAGSDLLLAETPTQLSAAFRETFRITLPPSYTGCLRIRVMANKMGGVIDPSPQIVPVSLSPNTIFRFKDIPLKYRMIATGGGGITTATQDNWSHIICTQADQIYASANVTQGDVELHVRVQPSASGVPNSIAFAIANSATNTIAVPTIEITQYNTFLSVQDNGTHDQLSLITASGNTFIYA